MSEIKNGRLDLDGTPAATKCNRATPLRLKGSTYRREIIHSALLSQETAADSLLDAPCALLTLDPVDSDSCHTQ